VKCGRQSRMWSTLVGRRPILSCHTGRCRHYTTLRGCEVPGADDLLWCGRPGSLTGRTFHEETRTCWGVLPGIRVIMMIMHAHVVELICQAVMGRAPVLKCLVLDVRGCL
jgi:hypothetical protein